jgi:UDP-N-acetylglucosamine transferase subunit ALG13
MIFVTVSGLPFERLIKKVDEIAEGLKEDVIMQIGRTGYEPKNIKWFRFETSKKIEELYKKADTIITHGGAGSIIKSLSYGKTPVVVPRYKKFGEHINDHQLDLTKFLDKKGYITAVYDIHDLKSKIKTKRKQKILSSKKKDLIGFLKGWVQNLEKEGLV